MLRIVYVMCVMVYAFEIVNSQGATNEKNEKNQKYE